MSESGNLTLERARELGCTCAWLEGFGVGEVAEKWAYKILSDDPDCAYHRPQTR